MITMRFNYAEIIDTDWTAITIEVFENGQVAHAFRNYVPEELEKEICGNQTDTFQLPDLSTALQMIRSNPSYRACSVEVLADGPITNVHAIVPNPKAIHDTEATCTMCGATSRDCWETEPTRSVRHSIGSRFWDAPEVATSPMERSTLCDECQAGVEGLRNSGATRCS
jgi:hypothetical protein